MQTNMARMNITSLCVVLLTVCISITHALKCYRCNSFDDPACFDVYFESSGASNDSMVRRPKLDPFLVECGQNETGRVPFCRKITITVLKGEHHRVVRDCGYERSNTDCYKADNEGHLETVCQCWTDGCNSAVRNGHVLVQFVGFIVLLKLFYN
ncbi:uncharacterized protein LOC129731866 [Wyeomyia smithii]|uniref:uncharacterized protein LOC129731866 n=1 Tax=Wyeomyia smithii TaxID=174621 RepID=UPI002467F9D8|nr:uncharacterized protein LOC129731866 [Wyeomyia smithii]